MFFKRVLTSALATLAVLGGAATANAADEWPTRPIRIVVPYPAGGSSDIIARLISQQLGAALKQTVIVDNRPGANGNLGAGQVALATDQHTFLLCDVGALAISPSVYKTLSFDPSKDLRGVSMLAYSPHILAVNPSVPANTLSELVALAGKQPISFAVTAIGSAPHLAGVAVEQATKAKWLYVPYKGGSQAVTDTMGGQTQVIMNGMLATLPYVKSGKLKAIAISKRERMALVPDIPTLAEQGMTGFESGTWQGVMAPVGTPDAAVTRLSAELARVIASPEIKAKLLEQGAEVVVQNPKELDTFFNGERKRWATVVEKGNIKLD
jgi:tripartite-type tricarboxylate transporter receptor subunit TctC